MNEQYFLHLSLWGKCVYIFLDTFVGSRVSVEWAQSKSSVVTSRWLVVWMLWWVV